MNLVTLLTLHFFESSQYVHFQSLASFVPALRINPLHMCAESGFHSQSAFEASRNTIHTLRKVISKGGQQSMHS